jgi:FkbM family methyltransferase
MYKMLFKILKLLPLGRVPIALFLLKKGWYPKEKIRFKHEDGFFMMLDLSDWVQLVIYLFGDYKYEKKEVLLWKKMSAHASRVIDIGAHVGYYSLLACSTNKNIILDAFEPSIKTFNSLKDNFELNDFSVQLHYSALSKTQGEVTMAIPDANNSGMNYLNSDTTGNKETVKMNTLDNFYHDKDKSKNVDLVKIDAEGSEYDILVGGKSFINSCKPVIFIELLNSTLNRFDADTGMVYKLMESLGYQFYFLNNNSQLQQCVSGQEGEVLILIPKEKYESVVNSM